MFCCGLPLTLQLSSTLLLRPIHFYFLVVVCGKLSLMQGLSRNVARLPAVWRTRNVRWATQASGLKGKVALITGASSGVRQYRCGLRQEWKPCRFSKIFC